MYERWAVWRGESVAFVLYPVTSGQFYLRYRLGVRRRDDVDVDDDDEERCVDPAATTRAMYNSPRIVVPDMMSSANPRDVAVIIPEQAWEVEEGDVDVDSSSFGVGGGLGPPPQFVGRVERPTTSRLNGSLMDSPSPVRAGGWVG